MSGTATPPPLNVTPPHSQCHTTSLSMSHHLTAQSGHYTLLLLSCHCLPYSGQSVWGPWRVAQPQSTVWIPMALSWSVGHQTELSGSGTSHSQLVLKDPLPLCTDCLHCTTARQETNDNDCTYVLLDEGYYHARSHVGGWWGWHRQDFVHGVAAKTYQTCSTHQTAACATGACARVGSGWSDQGPPPVADRQVQCQHSPTPPLNP